MNIDDLKKDIKTHILGSHDGLHETQLHNMIHHTVDYLHAKGLLMVWRDLEECDTANMKDGDSVLLHVSGHGVVRARSVIDIDGMQVWVNWHTHKRIMRATHWMPLPKGGA